jgi:hypothetical protein
VVDTVAGGISLELCIPCRLFYLRPRFDGFVRFFEAAALQIDRCLRGEVTDADLLRWLNAHVLPAER